MKIKTGINIPSPSLNNKVNSSQQQVGKVYGVITTEDTPTKELFEKYGGWNGIGTVFYQNYNSSKRDEEVNLDQCNTAKPLHASTQTYPLVGELILIVDGPAPLSQLNDIPSQRYYSGTINLWNNNQQNSPSGNNLGKTFKENADIRNLIAFEGDRIYQGRKGNGLRFGSTVKSSLNEWSTVGNDGDPITILANGYITTDKKSLKPNIEEINKELSSLYLTSSQKLPLNVNTKGVLNPLTKPILPQNYSFSQAILSGERVVLNARKDEVMLFAKTNVEISTDNIINLNAGKWVHINSPVILIGIKDNGAPPDEPMVLGIKAVNLLVDILYEISVFCSGLQSAVSTPTGAPLADINTAAANLSPKLETFMKNAKKILSEKSFVA